PMTLLGAIDDATSRLLALHFRPTEDLHGYAVVFDQVFRQYGLLLAVYGDRLNILARNDDHWSLEKELHGAQHPTHLGRILQELGVGLVRSPIRRQNGGVSPSTSRYSPGSACRAPKGRLAVDIPRSCSPWKSEGGLDGTHPGGRKITPASHTARSELKRLDPDAR